MKYIKDFDRWNRRKKHLNRLDKTDIQQFSEREMTIPPT